jgi:hypothetical protein
MSSIKNISFEIKQSLGLSNNRIYIEFYLNILGRSTVYRSLNKIKNRYFPNYSNQMPILPILHELNLRTVRSQLA